MAKKSMEELYANEDFKIIIVAFQNIIDPEFGVDIWNMGLIYNIELIREDSVKVEMTFTNPMCPYGEMLIASVEKELEYLGYKNPVVEVVFEPFWEPTEELREMIGI